MVLDPVGDQEKSEEEPEGIWLPTEKGRLNKSCGDGLTIPGRRWNLLLRASSELPNTFGRWEWKKSLHLMMLEKIFSASSCWARDDMLVDELLALRGGGET